MTSRGGKQIRLLNTDSSLESLKISTNFTSHRENKKADLIKIEELKYKQAEDGWRRFNSLTSLHSCSDNELVLGQTIQSTNTSKTKHLVINATKREFQQQKQQLDHQIEQEIAQFQHLIAQKEQVIREIEGQVRQREKVNEKRAKIYSSEVTDKLKQAEDKMKYKKMQKKAKEDQKEQVYNQIEQDQQKLEELKSKLKTKKDVHEARVMDLRQQRDDMEYQKSNQMAMHEAKVQNLDCQITQLNEQLQYVMARTCEIEKGLNELSLKQIGLEGTERDIRQIEKRISLETSRLSKSKIDIESDSQNLNNTLKLREHSLQDCQNASDSLKKKEIELFEKETQEYDLSHKQQEIHRTLTSMKHLISQKQQELERLKEEANRKNYQIDREIELINFQEDEIDQETNVLKFCVQGLKDKSQELNLQKQQALKMLEIMKERLIIENRSEYEMMTYELNSSVLYRKKDKQQRQIELEQIQLREREVKLKERQHQLKQSMVSSMYINNQINLPFSEDVLQSPPQVDLRKINPPFSSLEFCEQFSDNKGSGQVKIEDFINIQRKDQVDQELINSVFPQNNKTTAETKNNNDIIPDYEDPEPFLNDESFLLNDAEENDVFQLLSNNQEYHQNFNTLLMQTSINNQLT